MQSLRLGVPNYKSPNTPYIYQGSRRSWLVNKDFFASVLETAFRWFQLQTKVLSNVGDWDCCVGNVYRTGTPTQRAMPFHCRLIKFASTDSKRIVLPQGKLNSRASSHFVDGAKNKSNSYSLLLFPAISFLLFIHEKFYFFSTFSLSRSLDSFQIFGKKFSKIRIYQMGLGRSKHVERGYKTREMPLFSNKNDSF